MPTVRSKNGLDFTKSAERLLPSLSATTYLMQDFLGANLAYSAPDFSLSLPKKMPV